MSNVISSLWTGLKTCSSKVWSCLYNQSPAFQSIGVIVIPIALFWAANLIKGADDRQAEKLREQQEQQAQQLREQQEQQARMARAQTAVANYFNQLSTILVQGDLKSNPELSTFLTASTVTLLEDPDLQDNWHTVCRIPGNPAWSNKAVLGVSPLTNCIALNLDHLLGLGLENNPQDSSGPICSIPTQPDWSSLSDQQSSPSRKELVIKHLIKGELVQATSSSPKPLVVQESLERLAVVQVSHETEIA